MVKNEAYVEGYAALSSAFTKQLEQSKQKFIINKTEKNAWDFYYNYNILYRLRCKGENAYLAMSKEKGFAKYFYDFGYAAKEEVVNDTLQLLEDKCQFKLKNAINIPESCQFATKSVINCPVDVSIYKTDGTFITKLLDGVESDVNNDYGRFAVVYDSYSGDYMKIICLNSKEDVSIQMTGINDGLVNMELTQMENAEDSKNRVYTFNNVPVSTGAIIKTTVVLVVKRIQKLLIFPALLILHYLKQVMFIMERKENRM